MNTTLPASAHDLIPPDVLAKAARLAFDTLVSILSDAKAAANERRIAALAVLRLAFPTKRAERLERAGSASSRCTSALETPPPTPPASPPTDDPRPLADGRGSFTPRPTPARNIAALAGASPVTAPRTPPPRLSG